jgi:hypothetical protein
MIALGMVRDEIDRGGPHAALLRRRELGLVDQQIAAITQHRAALVGAHKPGRLSE